MWSDYLMWERLSEEPRATKHTLKVLEEKAMAVDRESSGYGYASAVMPTVAYSTYISVLVNWSVARARTGQTDTLEK
jgi:hypothetical protein